MQWETVIGIGNHALLPAMSKMLDAAHQYQTVAGWRQSVRDV